MATLFKVFTICHLCLLGLMVIFGAILDWIGSKNHSMAEEIRQYQDRTTLQLAYGLFSAALTMIGALVIIVIRLCGK